ncbi:MAG: transposase, partial [bacterium]
IKGIGIVSAAGIIGEVGDFRDYQNQSEILKMAGLDLYEISSGKHKGERHITKRGRSLLRKLLYFASLNMVKKNGIMYNNYQRLINNGMLKTKALIAISKKLLMIMFAMVRDNKDYVKDYHTYNCQQLKMAA